MECSVSVAEALLMGHGCFEAEDGEDHDTGEHGSEAVRQGDHDSVFVAVVVHRVIG